MKDLYKIQHENHTAVRAKVTIAHALHSPTHGKGTLNGNVSVRGSSGSGREKGACFEVSETLVANKSSQVYRSR